MAWSWDNRVCRTKDQGGPVVQCATLVCRTSVCSSRSPAACTRRRKAGHGPPGGCTTPSASGRGPRLARTGTPSAAPSPPIKPSPRPGLLLAACGTPLCRVPGVRQSHSTAPSISMRDTLKDPRPADVVAAGDRASGCADDAFLGAAYTTAVTSHNPFIDSDGPARCTGCSSP
jgi:hypothetical protein